MFTLKEKYAKEDLLMFLDIYLTLTNPSVYLLLRGRLALLGSLLGNSFGLLKESGVLLQRCTPDVAGDADPLQTKTIFISSPNSPLFSPIKPDPGSMNSCNRTDLSVQIFKEISLINSAWSTKLERFLQLLAPPFSFHPSPSLSSPTLTPLSSYLLSPHP